MDEKNKDQFVWRAHPARDRLTAATAGMVVIVAVGVLVVAICHLDGLSPTISIFWGFAAMGFVLATVSRFYFPSRFVLDDSGIIADYPLRTMRLRWSDVRRFAFDGRGGVLSRRARPSVIDGFQSIALIFPPESRDDAIQRIRGRIPANISVNDLRVPAHSDQLKSGPSEQGNSEGESQSWAG